MNFAPSRAVDEDCPMASPVGGSMLGTIVFFAIRLPKLAGTGLTFDVLRCTVSVEKLKCLRISSSSTIQFNACYDNRNRVGVTSAGMTMPMHRTKP